MVFAEDVEAHKAGDGLGRCRALLCGLATRPEELIESISYCFVEDDIVDLGHRRGK